MPFDNTPYPPTTLEERINAAWRRGYEAGLAGDDRCPYDTATLFGPWINGHAAGGQDRRASLARKVA